MISRHRYVQLDDDIRANQMAGRNAANREEWRKRMQRAQPPDLRSDEDMKRYHQLQFELGRARRVLRARRLRLEKQRT